MYTLDIPVKTITLPGGPEMHFISIEGGTFWMGSEELDREQPRHPVTVPDFQLGQFPVTVAQFRVFTRAAGWDEKYVERLGRLNSPNHPAVWMSWQEAVAFCDWLSDARKVPGRVRLPSEAEWEYAAIGGQQSGKRDEKGVVEANFSYAGSHRLQEVGWYKDNSHGGTMPVGLKLPNELGLYDMSGNVWEWCQDVWHDDYKGAPKDGSAWIKGGEQGRRVVRGGSWIYNVYDSRVSYRVRSLHYVFGYLDYGFRVVRY